MRKVRVVEFKKNRSCLRADQFNWQIVKSFAPVVSHFSQLHGLIPYWIIGDMESWGLNTFRFWIAMSRCLMFQKMYSTTIRAEPPTSGWWTREDTMHSTVGYVKTRGHQHENVHPQLMCGPGVSDRSSCSGCFMIFMILSILSHIYRNLPQILHSYIIHSRWIWSDHNQKAMFHPNNALQLLVDTRTHTHTLLPDTSSLCITYGQHWTTKYSLPECMQSFQRPN